MLDTRDRAAGVNARPLQSPGLGASGGARAAARRMRRAVKVDGPLEDYLHDTRFDASDPAALGTVLRALVERGYDRAPAVPLPGHGDTLARWRALAAVAACDLGLVKLFEGHTDALAILAELQAPEPPAGSRWGVWAAEPPDARVQALKVGFRSDGEGLRLAGTKAWCSGAGVVTHALVTAWLEGEPVLAAVAMNQPSISIDTSKWQAVGMQATASADVTFAQTSATLVGAAHDYVRRPGFWHGGAGIAACWYGAAAQIGRTLREASTQRADSHRLAHLGAIEVALAGAAAVLRETAAHIDANPLADSQREAMRARLVVEQAASAVMHHATRTLGAGPLCRNARFARALADLPVFLRQSHAERDLEALGELSAAAGAGEGRDEAGAGGDPWLL
ncbi:acyl-CoA dehydrogenase [Paraburkholderia aromaticivorans]|uniref:Acyl-CoA dehydrogenase n=1 Tax=Paraburkholderia aromaticivorans TaxID=2026199 RepID=A0A248VJP5_9BURK|nr:acyl-CoA dehydrogenase [Paraburkholderia aromaticivorans]ASV99200.1 acyl-CoA dehydrogenase [Paraburkholderia aromaticivorans]